MIWVDYAILAIVGVSGVLGRRRGFVKLTLSLVGWLAAFWIAIAYAGRVTPWLEGHVAVPSWLEGYVTVAFVRWCIGFVVLFLVVLLACGGVVRMTGTLVARADMSGPDRTLGMVFGLLRGVVIVALLVLLAGLTRLPREPWWSESSLLPHFVDVSREITTYLPEAFQQRLNFEPERQPDCGSEQQPDCDPERQLDLESER